MKNVCGKRHAHKPIVCMSFLILLLVALGPLTQVFAQTTGMPAGVSVSIRYFDKSIYFPNSDVQIKVTITNDSGSTYRFRVADNRIYSIDFDVRSMTNVEVERSQKFTTQMSSNQPVFFREVSLEPGVEYGFTENLADFRDITDPGMYVVTATFFPELNSGTAPAGIESNQLTLSVQPSLKGVAAVQAQINQSTGAILTQEPLPPDQVVTFTLNARQHGDWNKFFLYLDVESLLRRNPDRERRFVRMSAQEQQAYLDQFRKSLEQQTVEGDISVIPTSFQIIRTSYTPTTGTVEVMERFKQTSFTEVKRYTYTLQRQDQVWMITNYEVQNLGTE